MSLKMIFLLAFILLVSNVFAQQRDTAQFRGKPAGMDNHLIVSNKQWVEGLKVVALYSASIILNGVGDGLNNNGAKTYGHMCNAASIGLLVSSPFLLHYDSHKWFNYVASYVSLRVSIFDVSYNLTRKLPLTYVGTTAPGDVIARSIGINPNIPRSLFFVVGVSLPLEML